MESNALVEKQDKLNTKQKAIAEVFELAGPDADFSQKSVLEKLGATDSTDAVAKLGQWNTEAGVIFQELKDLQKSEIKKDMEDRETARRVPIRAPVHSGPLDTRVKSFGELFTESKTYTEGWKKYRQREQVTEIDLDLKTLFQTTAGFAPESTRSGLVVEAVTRPIQVLDLIPTRPINQAVDKYMEETTRTHAAAERAEGTTYPESAFVFTERTNPVQKIADSIPVTDEQLEDAPEVSGILDQRLRFGLRQRADLQVLVGNGTSPNLRGILNVVGIQTQAKGADPVFDAIFKAFTLVRVTGRAIPNAIVMHPTDYQNMRLTRTAAGEYIMGPPMVPGSTVLFGVNIALSDAITLGTAIVGDLANFAYIGERRGIEVQIGYISTQFVQGQKTLRADLRMVFTVTRPAAFVQVTGL